MTITVVETSPARPRVTVLENNKAIEIISPPVYNTIEVNNLALVSPEVNDLTASVVWADVPDGNITESSVVQHESALTITESQIADLKEYLTEVPSEFLTQTEGDARYLQSFTEINDLTTSVTWADVPDANITESSVTQHQGALTITESQISDLQNYLTSETITSISFGDNTLSYTDESGAITNLDLSQYLDDTNLARLISGTLDEEGIATFTRDDETTFTVDFSPLFDDTNLARVDSASFNVSTGLLTLTRNDATAVTTNLDGRFLLDITGENLEDLNNVSSTAPTASEDGFVLTWNSSAGEWQAIEAGSPHSYISWATSGQENEFRTSELFYDDDDSPNTIRSVSIVDNKLRIELATFSPALSASGQSRSWDQPATQFTVSVDNPSDVTNQWISDLVLIDNATGVHTNVANFTTSGPSVTPSGGVDWNQTFTTNATATIYASGTGLTGGSASARLTFADNFGTNYTSDRPTISYTWSNANVTLNFSNLSGNNFLQFYSSVGYNVNVSGISNSNNYSHNIVGVGGTLSNNAGSGSMAFDVGLHKNNNSGRSVSVTTTFSRPAYVTGTAYTVDDTATDSSINASFTYPSFYIWTGNTSTTPTRADIVTGYNFDSEVTTLGNQTRTLSTFINNTESTPRAFWFGVRSSAAQPSSFQTGSSASLLSDVSAVTQTVALQPDSPLAGYNAENYTLYGITLQPGSTYVSIS